MSRKLLHAVLALPLSASVCAGPATAPASRSATRPAAPASRPAVDLADLQREWDAALRHVSRARIEAGNRFDATPGGKTANAEVAAKRKRLEEMRALGSPQDRVEASSAYNKARAVRDQARDDSVASDAEVVRALAAAEQARAALERARGGLRTASTIADPNAIPSATPPAITIRPEYRVESGKSFAGMRSISITFTIIGGPDQVETVLHKELTSAIEKDPPAADVVIYARDDNGGRLTTPDGSAGLVFVEAEHKIVTLKQWASRRDK